jgi:hypothetical protein
LQKNKVTSILIVLPENPTRRARQAERARLPRHRFFGSFSQTRVVPGFSAAREPLVIDKSANATSRPGSTRGWSISGVMAVEGRRRPLFTARGVRNRPGPRPKNARSIRIFRGKRFFVFVSRNRERKTARFRVVSLFARDSLAQHARDDVLVTHAPRAASHDGRPLG